MEATNIKLTIAYDGSNYVGWQRQPQLQGVSIQQCLEQALAQVLGHQAVLHGAGRTDSGVHALCQVANFSCDLPIPIAKMAQVINNQLPRDIRIVAAEVASPQFHARYSPHKKCYRYLLEQGKRNSPFARNYSWQLPGELDLLAMRMGALSLVGEHDFRHYTLSKCSVENYLRTIYSLDIYPPPEGEAFFPWQQLHQPLVIDVTGNGFLYKMVRLIVGRLVAVGQGKIPSSTMAAYLEGLWQQNIPPAPAQGLFLQQIYYHE